MGFISKIINIIKFSHDPNQLIFVHIGKCGGVTLENALKSSPLVKDLFATVHKVHIRKPPILKNASYAIVVRNPIDRAISAFNWRYKLVVTDELQKYRFEGEHEILKKYGTLNALSEALYQDGVLNLSVADEFQKIHHLKENISFYLKPLLDEISPSQLFAVFATETLDDDISTILGVQNDIYINQNSNQTPDKKKYFSEKAYQNLKTYLKDDYSYLSKLLTMNITSSAEKNSLLR